MRRTGERKERASAHHAGESDTLEVIADVLEDRGDLRAKQDKRGNNHDGYERDDECILDQTLSRLSCHETRVHTTPPHLFHMLQTSCRDPCEARKVYTRCLVDAIVNCRSRPDMKVDVTTLSTRDDRAEWRFAWVLRLPSAPASARSFARAGSANRERLCQVWR